MLLLTSVSKPAAGLEAAATAEPTTAAAADPAPTAAAAPGGTAAGESAGAEIRIGMGGAAAVLAPDLLP